MNKFLNILLFVSLSWNLVAQTTASTYNGSLQTYAVAAGVHSLIIDA
jgi:hypothetical protein